MFLVLEATIGFNKRDENAETTKTIRRKPNPRSRNFESGNKIKWTSQDHKFLRALKIAVDEEK